MVGTIVCLFILGTPDEVRWLSAEEKITAKARVIENQLGGETTSKRWSWEQFWEWFRDPQVYFVFFNTFLACIPNGGIITFSSLLYVTSGLTVGVICCMAFLDRQCTLLFSSRWLPIFESSKTNAYMLWPYHTSSLAQDCLRCLCC